MKTKFLFSILLLTILITFTSCASKEPAPPRERDETFIADIDSFKVDDFHLYAAFGINKPKIQDFTVYFSPRTNNIYFKGRVGIDFVQAVFSYNERIKILEAKEKYIIDYTEKSFPKEKPNKKNAYCIGNTTVSWGSIGLGHEVDTIYMTNVQSILDNKPYFRILFEQAKEEIDDGVSSPRFSIYISPAQWENIIEACNQQALEARCDEILAEADAF